MARPSRFFFGTSLSDVINGNQLANYIFSFGGDDEIYAGGGNDVVFSYGGDDYIEAGSGNDLVFSGFGNDTVFGGSGRDTIFAGSGNDFVDGGSGNDYISGSFGDDVLLGGSGRDSIFGGQDDDQIDGGSGNDRLYGDSGNDNILGGSGRDFIYAGTGDDIVDGGAGRDVVYAESGNDTLIFSSVDNDGGRDFYSGGTGVDTLVLNLSAEEFASQEVADDFAAFFAFQDANRAGNGEVFGPNFTFSSLNLRVYSIENLRVFVDGIEVDTADAGPGDPNGGNDPIAVNDSYTINEDGQIAGFVTDNDTFDAGTTVTLISGVSQGELTLESDGSFSFSTAGDFNNLAQGETATVSFTYELSGGGSTNQATATVTVTGTNDAPTVSAPLIAGTAEGSGITTIDLLDGASDVDNGAILSVVLDAETLPAGVTLDGNVLTVDADSAAFNNLAAGETQDIVVNYLVSDENGATVPQTLTLTITGANDAPTVEAALTGGITEDGDIISVDLLAGASDVDNGAVLSVTGLPEILPPGVSVVGNTLEFDPSDDAYQSLSAGQTQDVVVNYLIADENGATVAQSLTLTVTGTNDAPIVTGTLSAGATEGGEVVTIDPLEGASDVDGPNLGITNISGLADGISYDPDTNQFIVDPSNGAYEALAVGETQITTITYDIVDGDDGVVAQTLEITITGTNDAPVVSNAIFWGVLENDPADTTIDLLQNASDIDVGDILSVAFEGELPEFLSLQGTNLIVDTNDPQFESLSTGDSVQLQLTFTVNDGNGGTAEQVLNLTVSGTNDAPVIDGTINANFTEGDAATTISLLSNVSDIDANDTVSIVNPTLTSVVLSSNSQSTPIGSFSINEDNTISIDPTLFDQLGEGVTATYTIDYIVTDGSVDTPLTATITVTGTNDAPVVETAISRSANEASGTVQVNMLQGVSDIDVEDVLSVDLGSVSELPAGVAVSQINGDFVLSLNTFDPAYDVLAVGETQELVVTYDVVDSVGARVTQTATFTITGTNDAPTIEAALTETATEDGEAVTVDLLAGASDVDNGAVLSVTGLPEVLPGGVTIDGASLSFDPSDAAYQALAEGETQDIVINYLVSDENGATVPQSLTLTITGTNDTPTVESAIELSITEGRLAFAFDALQGASDVDNGAVLSVANLSDLPDGVQFDSIANRFVIDPGNAAFDDLAADETRELTITYDIVDEFGATVPQSLTVTVTGTNDAPTVEAALEATISEDATVALVVDLLAGASDVDNGAVLNAVGLPELLPDGVTIDGSTLSFDPSGLVDYQSLAAGESDTITIDYQVSDGLGGIVDQSLTITIEGENDAPIRNAFTPNQTFGLDTPFNFSAPEGLFSDVDNGDSLTITAALFNGNDLPDFLSFDAETLTFSGTATALDAGVYTIRITATDESGATATDVFTLSLGGDFIIGTENNDTLTGTAANEVLIGLEGDDNLDGGRGNDTYVFNSGDGNDFINDSGFSGQTDTLQFTDYDLADATFSRDSNSANLLISFASGDSVRIANTLDGGSREIELFQFADQTIGIQDIRDTLLAQSQTDGDDIIYGFVFDETLEGGLGNDFMDGGRGNDTYIFNVGDGQDRIQDNGFSGQTDTLRFVGYDFADATFTMSATDSRDLLITFANGDSIDVQNTLDGGSNQVETYEFGDRTVDISEIREIVVNNQQTDGDDLIIGTVFNDALEGGLGNDTIRGGRGNDSYIFNAGDGQDLIEDRGFSGQTDELVFTDYAFADATFTRSTYDDVVISFANGDSVTIDATLNGGGSEVENIVFTDQTLTNAELRALLLDQSQTDGNDDIDGFIFNETLEGGLGNDDLSGGRGNDTYIFNQGDGQDTITDSGFSGQADVLRFTDYNLADATFTRDSYNTVTVSFANGDSVTVNATLNGGGSEVETFEFADQSIDMAALRDILLAQSQTDGDDDIDGFIFNETLEGGLGNDDLSGGRGNDTYIFNAGDGQDTIRDSGFSGQTDTMRFTDYTSSEAAYSRSGNDLTISFINGDSVTLFDALRNSGSEVEIYEFTDQTLAVSDIINILDSYNGTSGDDVINGTFIDDVLSGQAGNDIINGADGDDDIDGGDGNDTLSGDAGNDDLAGGSGDDSYLFNVGDGQDTITDSSGLADEVVFSGVDFADASFSAAGDNIVIDFANGDQVTVIDALVDGGDSIELFEFDDQTVFIADIIDLLTPDTGGQTITGTTGDDDLVGTAGDDTLIGLTGNDTLDGGEGSDSYIFSLGDGQDTFTDSGSSADTDTLFIEGYSRFETIIGLSPDGGLDMFFFADNNDFISIPGFAQGGEDFPSPTIEFVVWVNDPDDPTDDEVVSIEELLFGGPGGPIGVFAVGGEDDPDALF